MANDPNSQYRAGVAWCYEPEEPRPPAIVYEHNGVPYVREKQPFGFDLRRKHEKKGEDQ